MTCEQLDRFIQALRRELALQAEQAEGIEATVLGRVLEAVRRADASALGHSNMRALMDLDSGVRACVDCGGPRNLAIDGVLQIRCNSCDLKWRGR